MAGDRKPIKPAENKDYTPDMIFVLLALVIISIILARLNEYLNDFNIDYYELWLAVKAYFLEHWPFIKWTLFALGALAIFGIADVLLKLKKLNIEERAIFGVNPTLSEEENYQEKNERWEKIIELSNSTNESDWRHAIIEADGMLDEFLRSSGYHGESTGEMLKAVEKSDFTTLDQAWEAHKVRNRIAHSRGDFQLSDRETKRVISLYEMVFKEFEII